jgi:predicted lipoprotein with Yx(FWY)xxD motif
MNFHAIRTSSRRVSIIVAATALVACASMSDGMTPAKVSDGAMTNAGGMTLYTFDRDTAGSGKSACNGPCIVLWPALNASADAKATGDWAVVTRDDGTRQWAYKGKPLYTFSRDAKAGDRTGEGFNNVWHIARP